MMLKEFWVVKINDMGNPVAKYLARASYTEGENRKDRRGLEIDIPEYPDLVIDLSMKLLASVLGEKGIEHLVNEYCRGAIVGQEKSREVKTE